VPDKPRVPGLPVHPFRDLNRDPGTAEPPLPIGPTLQTIEMASSWAEMGVNSLF
jgi:hypothetical protein